MDDPLMATARAVPTPGACGSRPDASARTVAGRSPASDPGPAGGRPGSGRGRGTPRSRPWPRERPRCLGGRPGHPFDRSISSQCRRYRLDERGRRRGRLGGHLGRPADPLQPARAGGVAAKWPRRLLSDIAMATAAKRGSRLAPLAMVASHSRSGSPRGAARGVRAAARLRRRQTSGTSAIGSLMASPQSMPATKTASRCTKN